MFTEMLGYKKEVRRKTQMLVSYAIFADVASSPRHASSNEKDIGRWFMATAVARRDGQPACALVFPSHSCSDLRELKIMGRL